MATDRFLKGREALFEALSGVCNQIEAGLRQDEKNRALNTNATIQAQLDVIEKLRSENEAMREQLAKLQSSSDTPTKKAPSSTVENALPRQSTMPSPNTTVPIVPEDPTTAAGVACQMNCSKVLRRYHAIAANFKTAKDVLQRRKVEVMQWARHAEHLHAKLREAEQKYGIQILDHQAPRMDVPSSTAMDAEEGVLDPTLSFTSENVSESEAELPVLSSKTMPDTKVTIERRSSSQTTQGQASDAPSQSPDVHSLHDSAAVKQEEPSSDIPEIIIERKVKKRKRDDCGEETAVKTLVKIESNGSSSPIMSVPTAKLSTQESIDLGDIVQKVQTPRKRQWQGEGRPQTEIIPRFKLAALTPKSATAPKYSNSARQPRRNPVLMPLDGNIRPAKSNKEKPGKKDGRRGLFVGETALSEDCAPDEVAKSKNSTEDSRVRPPKSRLNILLDEGIEGIDCSTVSTPKRNQPTTSAQEPALRAPRRRQLPFDKNEDRGGKLVQASRVLATNQNGVVRSRASVSKLDQRQSTRRLRDKCPSDLSLSDFKINPSANDGHDFAFSEVVRDRADRTCLSGCVDMHCCGKEFRALAISQRPDPPLTSAQRQEEQKLLENYLGDSSYRLAIMDPKERMDLWIEAKTQELANKYGKHRHRFSRMQSPPGFWDADFPNTQKLETDRREAAKRAEQAIAERYREALRPDGKWKFMDE